MANINHARPQLKLLDNMRRELGKITADAAKPKANEDWPQYLRPVALQKNALIALSNLLRAIDLWSKGTATISFSDFPDDLKKAANDFANARLQHDYDNQYRGHNWVTKLKESKNPEERAWGVFLALFVKSGSD